MPESLLHTTRLRLADLATLIFGTEEWQKNFYSTSSWRSLIDQDKRVERVYKTADQEQITEFFVTRLKLEFAEVAQPGFLHNSRDAPLAFAAAKSNTNNSDKSARTP